jgi:hypothetical protein
MRGSTHIKLETLTDNDLSRIFGLMTETGVPLAPSYATRYSRADWMRKNLAKSYPNPLEVRVNPTDQCKMLFYNASGTLDVDLILEPPAIYAQVAENYDGKFSEEFPPQ